jgi:alkanesulfonate monooxygenase SsuD/methylene tetrahydromethanopterin reductase-like flavin-dependent oxidoreductase (luciferase family)
MTAREPRGVGVEGSLGPDTVSDLAALAERLGYGSFWFNVFGPTVEPYACLARALQATREIDIGVGLFPLDRFPAADIAARLSALGVASSRAIIGVAGGQIREGLLKLSREAVSLLHRELPGSRVALAGYGPKVLELGGRIGDVMLANWLTPERMHWFVTHTAKGAREAGRPTPPIYLYHRAATGAGAAERLRAELAQYRRFPVHQKHQADMGNPEQIGVAADQQADIAAQLRPYGPGCRIVLRPLPRDGADPGEWRALLAFFAPGASAARPPAGA